MSISPPPGAQLGLGLDVRHVPVRAAVPRGAPDDRNPDVVLRIQRRPLPGLPAQPEAPLRLSPLLRSRDQRGARSSSVSVSSFISDMDEDRRDAGPGGSTKTQADARDARGPLPLLERPPGRNAGHRRHVRPPALDQVLRQPGDAPRRRGLLPRRDAPEHLRERLHPPEVALVSSASQARPTPVSESLREPDQPHMPARGGRPAAFPGARGPQRVQLPARHRRVLPAKHPSPLSKTPSSRTL